MEKLSQSLEDYLEAILIVSQEKKVVRVKDVVKMLKVKTASVIGALRKLEQKGFVEHEHYGYIELTAKGHKKATRLYEKHKVLHRFLTDFLNVDGKIANEDACLIEHCISDETYGKIIDLIKMVENEPERLPQWFEKLKMPTAIDSISETVKERAQ